jgi:CheY-like chemotaxis protein
MFATISPEQGPVNNSRKRILCVDDDPPTLEIRRLLLDAAGYLPLTASSGAEALHVLRENPGVDLVLLDYAMPGMNGDELAGEIRKQYPNLPLVAVSAVGQLPKHFLAIVESTVQKGQDPEVLLTAVAKILEQPKASTLAPYTVLCVEDEELQLAMRQALFESAGFIVLKARSGKAAMEIFRAHHVDAVVLDYYLTGMNGTAVATEMKRLSPRTPIVMLSGFASLPGESAVVDAWLMKTAVEPEYLVNEVTRLIKPRNDMRRTATSLNE